MLKRKPANEYHQMLPDFIDEYEPKQNNIHFEYAREILMKEDDEMVLKSRFDRIYNMIECESYLKNEDVPDIKEIFVHGFKHNKRDEIDNFISIGCESDELYEMDKLFNFWSIKFLNKEIENRDFKITG